MRLTKRTNLSWRAVVAAAACIAASTLVSADSSSYQLGLSVSNPHIVFDGSSASRIAYDGLGGLTVDAGSSFITLPTGEQFLIVTITGGPFPLNSSGLCDPGTFYALDLNGINPACYADAGPAPPGAYGTFAIRAHVDALGNVVSGVSPGVPDACGVLNGGDDFCVKGTVLRCLDAPGNPQSCFSLPSPKWQMIYGPGPLISGKIKTDLGTQVFASQSHTLNTLGLDFFEFLFQVSGGQLANQYLNAIIGDPRKFVDVQAAAFPDLTTPFSWSHAFSESVEGAVDSVKAFPFFLPPADKCNGTISGSVLDALTLGGIADTTVSVMGGDLLTAERRTTLIDGLYVVNSSAKHATGLCAGDYSVYAAPPLGYAPLETYPSTVKVTVTKDASGSDSSSQVNFRFYQSGVISSNFQTFGQGAWGAKPKGHNAGYLLETYYFIPYGSGPVVIGGTNTVTLNGSEAIEDFLPQFGRAVPLDRSYTTNPIVTIGQRKPHNRLGSLAGETLALRLNVDFSANLLTRPGLDALHVGFGLLKGKTVKQVLDLGNLVLGGGPLPTGLKYDDVEDAIERINQNFEGGRDRHFLLP